MRKKIKQWNGSKEEKENSNGEERTKQKVDKRKRNDGEIKKQ